MCMCNYTELGCILRLYHFKEADVSVRILSKERGVFTAYAFGAKKSKRRFVGCLDTFSLIQYTLVPSRTNQYLTLQEATLVQETSHLRKHPSAYGMAKNCTNFLEKMCVLYQVHSQELYNTFISLLNLLEETTKVHTYLPYFFRMYLMLLIGYQPHIHACIVCGTPKDFMDTIYFSVQQGGILCKRCCSTTVSIQVKNPLVLELIQYILNTTPKEWNAIAVPYSVTQECVQLSEAFIQYHI